MNMQMIPFTLADKEQYLEQLKRRRVNYANFAVALQCMIDGIICCLISLSVPPREQPEALKSARLIIQAFATGVQNILVFDIDETLKMEEKAKRERPALLSQRLVTLCAQRDSLTEKIDCFIQAEEKTFAKYEEVRDTLGPVWGLMKEALADQLAQTNAAITDIQKEMEKTQA